MKLSEIVEEIKEAAEYILNMAAKFGTRYNYSCQHILGLLVFPLGHMHSAVSFMPVVLIKQLVLILDIFSSCLHVTMFPCFIVMYLVPRLFLTDCY